MIVAVIYQNIGHILVMLVLLVCSGFFSGSETAFFNLSLRQKRLLRQSAHRLQQLAAYLCSRERQMLSCLLLGNMAINVLYYATAGVFTIHIKQQIGVTAAAAAAFTTFMALVLFGEIIPKSLAYANSRSISVTAALPLYFIMQVLRPVLYIFRVLIAEPAIRLLLGHQTRPSPLTAEHFKTLIQQVGRKGLITGSETRLLTEVVELEALKVRNVMKPRVDMVTCSVNELPRRARKIMRQNNMTKICIHAGSVDKIIGVVYLRELLLRPALPLEKAVRKVYFVPEQKTVESLLEHFRRTNTDMAVVVDEYGGIAGSVRLEDVAEELVGPFEPYEFTEHIEQVGPFEYRFRGDTPIHDWAEALGVSLTDTKAATLGGLVIELLGRIPKAGDTLKWNNLKFTIERVSKHRIISLTLKIRQAENE